MHFLWATQWILSIRFTPDAAVNDPDVYHFSTIILDESLAGVLTLAAGFPPVTLTSIFLNLYFCRV